jgi:hypothetical protein
MKHLPYISFTFFPSKFCIISLLPGYSRIKFAEAGKKVLLGRQDKPVFLRSLRTCGPNDP